MFAAYRWHPVSATPSARAPSRSSLHHSNGSPHRWVGGAAWLFESVWKAFDSTTLVDLTDPAYIDVYNVLFGVAVFVTLILFCLQLTTGLTHHDPTALSRAAVGVAKSVLGSFVLVTITALLLEITDQLTIGIVEASGNTMEGMGDRIALLGASLFAQESATARHWLLGIAKSCAGPSAIELFELVGYLVSFPVQLPPADRVAHLDQTDLGEVGKTLFGEFLLDQFLVGTVCRLDDGMSALDPFSCERVGGNSSIGRFELELKLRLGFSTEHIWSTTFL